MRRALRDFFLSVLDDAAVEHVHVLVHSMGAILFFNALPEIHALLAERGKKLATCVLLNADSPLDEFVGTSFPMLRGCCDHITVYADVNDMALFWSRFVSYLSECLPFVPDIATRVPLGRYPYRLYREREMDRATMAAEALEDWRQLRIELPVDYLELDVVDTSTLDSNVHGMRHCYFNLNGFIVDDLAEIVTTRRRASMRRRLTHTVGNVYAFLAAPGHVNEV